MRYEIKNSQIVESIFIDAPYDTRLDALDAIKNGETHACCKCYTENGTKDCHTIEELTCLN